MYCMISLAVFLAVELPQGALTVMNALLECFTIAVYYPLGDLIDMLTLLQTSITFVLYTIMSRQFRDTFLSIFLYAPLRSLHLRFKDDSALLFERSESCRSRKVGGGASTGAAALGQWDSERSHRAGTPRTPRAARAARVSTCSAKTRVSQQHSTGSAKSRVSVTQLQSSASGSKLVSKQSGGCYSQKPSAVALVLEERHAESDSQSQSQCTPNTATGTTSD